MKANFKQRVFWCEIELYKPLEEQVETSFDYFFRNESQYNNTFTEKYSLNQDDIDDFDIVKSILS